MFRTAFRPLWHRESGFILYVFQMFLNRLFISHVTWFIKMFSLNFRWEILLFHIVAGIIVCVLITDSPAKLLVAAVMGVLKMDRYGCAGLFDRIHGGENRIYSSIAFGGTCHISDSLRKNDLCLRHTDALNSLSSGNSNAKCLRVSISNIL